ncbi:MAG: kinase [Pseudomonadota bacterium]
MIISRTPFRISFFGGGTDYPAWSRQHGGQVLSTTIDKYCYLTLRYLPPFFEHRYRVVYSKMENVKRVDEIMHPVVRETLRYLDFDTGLEIHHDGDLPARSGMGTSSSFTVGLLNAICALQGVVCGKMQLADQAIHIEQELVGDTVGSQDQAAVAFGGLNRIVFHKNGKVDVRPVSVSIDRINELNDNLMLFFTGVLRTASTIARQYVVDLERKEHLLRLMHQMVDTGIEILCSHRSLCSFGDLMHQGWLLKKSLSSEISNSCIDDVYGRALDAGALGGKITGAGGGGFMLLFVPRDDQARVREALGELLHIPFRFEGNGSQIIFHDPNVDDFRHIIDERDIRNFKCFTEMRRPSGTGAEKSCLELLKTAN